MRFLIIINTFIYKASDVIPKWPKKGRKKKKNTLKCILLFLCGCDIKRVQDYLRESLKEFNIWQSLQFHFGQTFLHRLSSTIWQPWVRRVDKRMDPKLFSTVTMSCESTLPWKTEILIADFFFSSSPKSTYLIFVL